MVKKTFSLLAFVSKKTYAVEIYSGTDDLKKWPFIANSSKGDLTCAPLENIGPICLSRVLREGIE